MRPLIAARARRRAVPRPRTPLHPSRGQGRLTVLQENLSVIVVLTLKGEFDSFVTNAFSNEIAKVNADGVHRIVLNMRLVKFVNSTALGAMIKARKQCRASGGDLVVSQPSARVRIDGGVGGYGSSSPSFVVVDKSGDRAEEVFDAFVGGSPRSARMISPAAPIMPSAACSWLLRRAFSFSSFSIRASSCFCSSDFGTGPVGRGAIALSISASARCTKLCMFTRAIPSSRAASLVVVRSPITARTRLKRGSRLAGTSGRGW
jgi:anti-anti-sigma factor